MFIGEPGEEHYNPIGVVHGGYASTILDSALGCAVHTTCPAGVGYTSQTLEVKYLRPITRDTGAVRAEAEVIHRGRKTADRRGEAHCGRDRQAARHRHQHLPHNPIAVTASRSSAAGPSGRTARPLGARP